MFECLSKWVWLKLISQITERSIYLLCLWMCMFKCVLRMCTNMCVYCISIHMRLCMRVCTRNGQENGCDCWGGLQISIEIVYGHLLTVNRNHTSVFDVHCDTVTVSCFIWFMRLQRDKWTLKQVIQLIFIPLSISCVVDGDGALFSGLLILTKSWPDGCERLVRRTGMDRSTITI